MFIYDVDEEISMRMLNVKDAKRLFQITDASRNYLREWLPWLDETKSIQDSTNFIKNGFHIYAAKTGLTAGIFYQGNLVGVTGFNSFDWTNKIGYIGYWISESHQGKGIITRSVQALMDYGFQECNLNRIEISAAYDNKSSQEIPKRLGFKKEGHIRQAEWLYDHFVDHIIYGMIRSDWN